MDPARQIGQPRLLSRAAVPIVVKCRILGTFLPLMCLSPGAWAEQPADGQHLSTSKLARLVDATLWSELSLDARAEIAPVVDDHRYLRRVYFDLIGRPPTVLELGLFATDRDPRKRSAVVRELLDDPAYGQNWANYWRDVILARRSEPRAVLASDSMVRYFADRFNANVGWDVIAHEMVTASGEIREHGETAVMVAQGGRPEETAAEVARLFLGIQIQCAQCHDHPTDAWTREQFHELAAFFPRVSMRPVREPDGRTFVVTARDVVPRRMPKGNRYAGRLEHSMPDLVHPEREGTVMTPRFFLNDAELPQGTSDQRRREELANWITSSDRPWFAYALVNRVWAELVGIGFYTPVDDLGPDRPCIAPKTVAALSNAFVESGYDLKYLLEVVTATQAYQRVAVSREETIPVDFRSAYPRRLRSDQLLNAVATVFDLPMDFERRKLRRPAAARERTPQRQFAQVFGFDPSEREGESGGSVTQALFAMNSPVLNHMLRADRGDGLSSLIDRFESDEDLIEHLYLRTLSRPPSDRETRAAVEYIQRTPMREEAFADLWWSLLNSAEFLYHG